MYATITRETLISTLQTAMLGNASVKRGHCTLPILACVKLSGQRAEQSSRCDTLTVTATYLEMTVTTTTNATNATTADVLVDGKALLAAVKGMPRKARVTLATREVTIMDGCAELLDVRCDGLTTTLDTWDVDDYPLLSAMPDNGAVAVLPAADVARMIGATAPHAATDDTRRVFTGIFTQLHDDHVTMAAADGYRLAEATTPLQSPPWANAAPPYGIGLIVPARCMVALAKIVGKGDGPVVVDCGNPSKEADRASFRYGDTTMTTRLISGKYVNYQQIIPAGHAATVTATTTELAAALDTFKRAAKGIGNEVMYVHEAEGGLVLSMAGEGSMGAFVRARVTTTTAEPMAPFAVNPAMLASAVASMGSVDSVALGTPDQACKPMTITAVGRDDVRVVVMPMSVGSNGIDHARDTARGITRNKYGLPSAPVADVAGHATVTATPDATAGDDGGEHVTAIREAAAEAECAMGDDPDALDALQGRVATTNDDDAGEKDSATAAPTCNDDATTAGDDALDPWELTTARYRAPATPWDGDGKRFYCEAISATSDDGSLYTHVCDRARGDMVVTAESNATYAANVCDRLNRNHVPTYRAYRIPYVVVYARDETATCAHDDAPAVTTTATPITTDDALEVIAMMDNETLAHCRYALQAANERGHTADSQWQHDGQVYWCQCAQCHGPIVVLDGAVHALPTSCQAGTGDDDAVDGPTRPQERATTPDDAVGQHDGDDAPVARVAVASVAITFTESAAPYDAGDDLPLVCDSLATADDILRTWARTAPDTGAYDKTDFTILFADGETYEGRYDLQRQDATRGDLIGAHVRAFCAFYAGQQRPAHLTAEQYTATLSYLSAEERAACARFLETYDLGGPDDGTPPTTDDDDHGARDSAPQATVEAYWDHAATQRLHDDDDARSAEYRAIYEANMATLHAETAQHDDVGTVTTSAPADATRYFDPTSRITWLAFPGKPDDATRATLKARGWRWSGFRKMWRTNSRVPVLPDGLTCDDGGTVDYAAERAERLEERAGKKAAEASAQWTRADDLAQMVNGQPILIGHHSEKRARRDQDRLHDWTHKGVEAYNAAERLQQAAESSRRHQAMKDDPGVVKRRIDRLQAERVAVVNQHSHPYHTCGDDCAAHRDSVLARIDAEIAENRALLEQTGGIPWDTLQPKVGDVVRLQRSGLARIVKINPKTFKADSYPRAHMPWPITYDKSEVVRIEQRAEA